MQVPNFLMGQPLDFSPVTNAFTGIRDQQNKNRAFGLQDRKLDEDRRQFDLTNALAQRTAARADQMQPYHIQQIQAQIAHLRSQGATEAQLLPLKMDYQRAMTDQARAHAELYRSSANATVSPRQVQADPTAGYGLAPDGSLIQAGLGGGGQPNPPPVPLPGLGLERRGGVGGFAGMPEPGEDVPRTQSIFLGAENDAADSVQRSHQDYGRYGSLPREVPGIVVTPKGVSDRLATQTAAGQAGADTLSPDARERFLNAKRTQDVFSYLYGKTPTGMAYDKTGKLIDLKQRESVQDRQAVAIAQEGLKALDYAERALLGKDGKDRTVGPIGQVFGDYGGLGEGGRAFKSAKAAVLDLNFAISGKSVSNAEREAFLNLYQPTALDSRETQKWKLGRVRSFFETALKARTAGASDDQIAELYRGAILEGQRGPQSAPTPMQGRLKNKYGLE